MDESKYLILNLAPIIFLVLVYSLLVELNKRILRNKISISIAGLLPVSILLTGAGILHFFSTSIMVKMIPDLLPYKLQLVYITGLLEILAAAGLLIKKYRRSTGILLILFLIAVLPANITGSLKHLPAAGMKEGISYLYVRIPLQLFFIAWVYYFSIYKHKNLRVDANHNR